MRYIIKSIFGLLMFGIIALGYGSWGMPGANAETVPQMRVRIFEEARTQHPDVWNGCDNQCVVSRLQAAPQLRGIAAQTCATPGGAGTLVCVDVNDLAKFSIVRDFQWGLEFEKMYGRPPNEHDWGLHFVPGLERVRYELAVSPVVFAWVSDDSRSYREKPEYRNASR